MKRLQWIRKTCWGRNEKKKERKKKNTFSPLLLVAFYKNCHMETSLP